MNVKQIIDKYFEGNAPLRRILRTHSEMVAETALRIIDDKELPLDRQFVRNAAMLHDIGIVRCNAPKIMCFGTEHYIRHGIAGAQMLREDAEEFGMTKGEIEPYARICERHTGAGLTAKEITEQGLPLPAVDFLPETTEEKLICYADKFFSKTRPMEEKTFEHVLRSLDKFSPETVERFLKLHQQFG